MYLMHTGETVEISNKRIYRTKTGFITMYELKLRHDHSFPTTKEVNNRFVRTESPWPKGHTYWLSATELAANGVPV